MFYIKLDENMIENFEKHSDTSKANSVGPMYNMYIETYVSQLVKIVLSNSQEGILPNNGSFVTKHG